MKHRNYTKRFGALLLLPCLLTAIFLAGCSTPKGLTDFHVNSLSSGFMHKTVTKTTFPDLKLHQVLFEVETQTFFLFILAIIAFAILLAIGFLFFSNKHLSKNLLERTAALSAIYSSIPDSIFCKNIEGLYTSCNPSFERQAGLSESELIGKTFAEVFPNRVNNPMEFYKDLDQKVIDGGFRQIVEENILYPDGTVRSLETLRAPLIQHGKVAGILGICRDVTERHEMKNQLACIINTAQIAFILSIGNVVVEVNEYSKHYLGAKPGDDVNKYCSDPKQRDDIIDIAKRQGTASNMIVRFHTVHGSDRRFLCTFTFVEYEKQNAYLVWGIDVEDDELKNDQIRTTQESFQTVLDALPVAIRIVDLETAKIVYTNDTLAQLLEYNKAEDLLGLPISTIVPEFLSDGTPSPTLDDVVMQEPGSPVSMELEYLTRNGRHIEAFVAARQIDYKGRCSSIGIIKDLTAEKEKARRLFEVAEREKEANQAKSKFLANMSHEIRTPMNSIIGMTDLLFGEPLQGRQLDYVKDIKTSAESLLGIINDILDFSKIGEGKLQAMPTDVDLQALFKNIVSMMHFSAQSKGLTFIDDLHIPARTYARLDDVRLKQVITNLLSNAIKFTQHGYVKLSAKIENNTIFVDVSDSGIGIKEEDLPLIFLAFEQADTKKNRAIQGTGLGLAISKSLVHLMGGNIWMESTYGSGTIFHVTLPFVPGDAAAVPVQDTTFQYLYAPTAQILLVDDIPANLTVGVGLLRMCGITADVAMTGFQAITLVGSRDYDMVFMDHMMPEMDGIETMKLIRQMGGKYTSLPIIALTANVIRESRNYLLASGMDDFLSKPIDKSELTRILKKWLPDHKIEERQCEGASDETSSVNALRVANIEGLNVDLTLSNIGGLSDVLETTLRQATYSTDDQLQKMSCALSEGDLHNFSIAAHGLKGLLANIGTPEYSNLASRLETASKSGNMDQCASEFSQFEARMEKFVRQLKVALCENDNFHQANLREPAPCRASGDLNLLLFKIEEVVEHLENFEATHAHKMLHELTLFSYGKETDALLDHAKAAISGFQYEKSIKFLKQILSKPIHSTEPIAL